MKLPATSELSPISQLLSFSLKTALQQETKIFSFDIHLIYETAILYLELFPISNYLVCSKILK